MLCLISLFLVSKLIHLVHVGSLLSKDFTNYRLEYAEIMAAYPHVDAVEEAGSETNSSSEAF